MGGGNQKSRAYALRLRIGSFRSGGGSTLEEPLAVRRFYCTPVQDVARAKRNPAKGEHRGQCPDGYRGRYGRVGNGRDTLPPQCCPEQKAKQ